MQLENIEKFMRLLHKVQNVQRVARVPDEEKYRNTAEHSFEMTMLCWYIVTVDKLDLDVEKVFMYALAHDVVEAYAGDTYIYDEEAKKTKKDREAKALERIHTEFSEFPDLWETIHLYEKREDEESRFVYAVDKLIDPLNISLEKGRTLWKEHNVSYAQIREYKDAKIAQHPHVEEYWKLVLKKVEAKQNFYFDTK